MAIKTPTDLIAADIVTHLTGRLTDETYTVTATDNPRLERESADAIQVQIIPAEETEDKRARGNRYLERNSVDMLVSAGVTETKSAELLRGVAYRLRRALRKVKMAGYTFSGIEPIDLYSVDELRNRDHFVSQWRINYVGLTGREILALEITTITLDDATVGVEYSAQLSATGGQSPYTWAVSSGSLPSGLTLSSGGLLSGTPTDATGSPFVFTVQVTDAAGATDDQQLVLFLIASESALYLNTLTLDQLNTLTLDQLNNLLLDDPAAPGPIDEQLPPTTPAKLIYDSYSGQGFVNTDAASWRTTLLADGYTLEEMDQVRYVPAPQVQAIGTSRDTDLSRWQDVRAYYVGQGLTPPKRLLVFRQDIFRFNNYGIDAYTNGTIYSAGPTWDLSGITTGHNGARIALPPASVIETPYQEKAGSGLSFAEVKTVLEAAGRGFSNAGDCPLGDGHPYIFQTVDASTWRILHQKVQPHNADWIAALTNFIIAALNDETQDLDGVMVSPMKCSDYYSGNSYHARPGKKPNGVNDGVSDRRLEYWTRTRSGGPSPDPDLAWDVATNTPEFDTSAAHAFDGFGDTSGMNYVDGLVAWVTALRAALPAGKELHCSLCFLTDDQGIWSYAAGGSNFRAGFRSEYVAAHGVTYQQAQDALLAKIMEIPPMVDGLIIPSAASNIVDPIASSVVLEPAGWWESLRDSGPIIQYAS